MTARTSAAVPPSDAWTKLACFSDTQAVPMRWPRRPRPSTRPPAVTSPGTGLTNTEPQFWPPGWCSRRHRTISAIVASARLAIAGGDPQPRRQHDHVVVEVRAAEPQAELVGAATTGAGPASSRSSSVASSEARWRCPIRARRRSSARPRRPCRARRRPTPSPVRPAAAVRRASTGRATPPPASTEPPAAASVSSMSPATSATLTAIPPKPPSATSRFEPRADHEHGEPRRLARRGDGQQVIERPRPHEQRRRAAHAIRRQRAERLVARRRAARARRPPR